MSNKDDGGPAFPAGPFTSDSIGKTIEYSYLGMSIRDYFAANAMQVQLAAIWDDDAGPGYRAHECVVDEDAADEIARSAYLMADAMLKARSK